MYTPANFVTDASSLLQPGTWQATGSTLLQAAMYTPTAISAIPYFWPLVAAGAVAGLAAYRYAEMHKLEPRSAVISVEEPQADSLEKGLRQDLEVETTGEIAGSPPKPTSTYNFPNATKNSVKEHGKAAGFGALSVGLALVGLYNFPYAMGVAAVAYLAAAGLKFVPVAKKCAPQEKCSTVADLAFAGMTLGLPGFVGTAVLDAAAYFAAPRLSATVESVNSFTTASFVKTISNASKAAQNGADYCLGR